MNYKIVVDSCCELPEALSQDSRFEHIPLGLEVGDYQILDDENFDQAEFLQKVAAYPKSPKSSCPSPERYREAYHTEAERVYVITLSSHLSGSYNSAVLGKSLYHEMYGAKQIYVFDSESASCGETQIALKIIDLEEQGLPFNTITEEVNKFRDGMHTYFVLDNLDTLRKNGRLTGVKALVASTLSIKPVMGSDRGQIIQRGQCIGIKKAIGKMADLLMAEVVNPEQKRLIITHCHALERAQTLKELILSKMSFLDAIIMDTAGISSMYANSGGVIVTV
jgi:DegV family protein with EDD domain